MSFEVFTTAHQKLLHKLAQICGTLKIEDNDGQQKLPWVMILKSKIAHQFQDCIFPTNEKAAGDTMVNHIYKTKIKANIGDI